VKGKQAGQANKSGGHAKNKNISNRLSPADKCPIQTVLTHGGIAIKTKIPFKGYQKGQNTHAQSQSHALLSQQKRLLTMPLCLSQQLTKANSPEMSLMLTCWICSTLGCPNNLADLLGKN
jgi:hypothetical protein